MKITLTRRVPLVVTLLAGLIAFALVAPARADEPLRPPFYETPAQLPAENGSVVRHEPVRYLLDPANLAGLVRDARRVMYKSSDRTGKPIATTGTVLVPRTPWIGLGRRPVIGYAPGTQGMADRCAPSRQWSEGFEYEAPAIEALLSRGYAVAVADYEGLGTEGIHPYLDRVSQGQTTLDVVRAAQRLKGSGLDSNSPVGLMGYSQGGAAAASAAELAANYAPELKVKGAAVGSVPADLSRIAGLHDGGLYAGFLFFAVRGLSDSYAVDLAPYLNDAGRQKMSDVEQKCVTQLFSDSFVKSEGLTADGKPLSSKLTDEPFATMIDEQRIGRIRPRFPVRISHSRIDEIVPYSIGRQLARDWCSLGANVRLSSNVSPTHVGGYPPHIAEALPFFEARFSGLSQISNCWRL